MQRIECKQQQWDEWLTRVVDEESYDDRHHQKCLNAEEKCKPVHWSSGMEQCEAIVTDDDDDVDEWESVYVRVYMCVSVRVWEDRWVKLKLLVRLVARPLPYFTDDQ